MDRMAFNAGKLSKAGLAAIGLAVMAIPATSAFASAEDPTAKLSEEQAEQARQIFTDWSCGQCHSLSDAGGVGHIGPAFDGNDGLTHDFVVGRITNGQGAMPGFGGQLTDEEIDLLSKYIVQAKK
ncbi:Cytochrome c6 precursor [Croceibacterium atlanticum]|uniref:Cytochrome c6 n=2 Tax=Croceibacterium atlanticum TaxID=1267766 RepID=A0A0F7KNV6_9SPHN|nr:Cytochrome c6 precursor [Croceibacterium atlanticum]